MSKRRTRTILASSIGLLMIIGTAVVAGSQSSEPDNTVDDDFDLLECTAPMKVVRTLEYGPEVGTDPRASADIAEAVHAWVADVYYGTATVPSFVEVAALPTPVGVEEDSRWGLTENGQLKAVMYFDRSPSGRWRLGQHVACGDWQATHDRLTGDVPQ